MGKQPELEIADPRFDAFWAKYPRKAAKPYARRAFNAALKRASFEAIMAGLNQYAFSRDHQFRPHPATWLNQDRWVIEADTAPPTVVVEAPKGKLGWMEQYQVLWVSSVVIYHNDSALEPPTIEGKLVDE